MMTAKQPIALNLYFNGLWSEAYLHRVPESSGIYAIYEGRYLNGKVQLSHVIYIGKAKNVRSRLADHEKLEEIKSNLREGWGMYVSVARVYNSMVLARVEAALIHRLQPEFNLDGIDCFAYGPTTLKIHDTYGLMPSEIVFQGGEMLHSIA